MTQRLRTIIDARKMSFGTTPNGADWCIKALHPSDPLTEVRGIPDHSAVPSLVMNYQATVTLSCSPGAVTPWSFDASLLPHPIQFMYLKMTDNIYPNGYVTDLLNPQIAGATHTAKYSTLIAMAQRWRMAYASVSVYQDGADLANQGTLVVSQPPVCPRVVYPSTQSNVNDCYCGCKGVYFNVADEPNFLNSQSMPNAYFNRSREGAYVPLKLTETCQDWVSESDSISPIINGGFGATPDTCSLTLGHAGFANFPYPFPDLAPMLHTAGVLHGDATSGFMNGTWAHISARNLAVSTSYTFFVRMGVEMQVSPNSTLAPQLKLSPAYDRQALDTYFAIARELKDAYPSDHNSLGKIWDVISKALTVVTPALAAGLPVYGVPAAMALTGIQKIGDRARASRRARSASQAQIDRAIQAREIPAIQQGPQRQYAVISTPKSQQGVRTFTPRVARIKRKGKSRVYGTASQLDPRQGMQVVRL